MENCFRNQNFRHSKIGFHANHKGDLLDLGILSVFSDSRKENILKKRGTNWRWILKSTLLGTNISPENGILKLIFLFPRWDMYPFPGGYLLMSYWKKTWSSLFIRHCCVRGLLRQPVPRFRQPSSGACYVEGHWTVDQPIAKRSVSAVHKLSRRKVI